MRIAHKGTEPGSVLSTPEGEFTADGDGFFEVPDHLGAAQVKFPGWKQAGQDRFSGDPEPKEGVEDTSNFLALVAGLTRRVDDLEAEVKRLGAPAKRASTTGK